MSSSTKRHCDRALRRVQFISKTITNLSAGWTYAAMYVWSVTLTGIFAELDKGLDEDGTPYTWLDRPGGSWLYCCPGHPGAVKCPWRFP